MAMVHPGPAAFGNFARAFPSPPTRPSSVVCRRVAETRTVVDSLLPLGGGGMAGRCRDSSATRQGPRAIRSFGGAARGGKQPRGSGNVRPRSASAPRPSPCRTPPRTPAASRGRAPKAVQKPSNAYCAYAALADVDLEPRMKPTGATTAPSPARAPAPAILQPEVQVADMGVRRRPSLATRIRAATLERARQVRQSVGWQLPCRANPVEEWRSLDSGPRGAWTSIEPAIDSSLPNGSEETESAREEEGEWPSVYLSSDPHQHMQEDFVETSSTEEAYDLSTHLSMVPARGWLPDQEEPPARPPSRRGGGGDSRPLPPRRGSEAAHSPVASPHASEFQRPPSRGGVSWQPLGQTEPPDYETSLPEHFAQFEQLIQSDDPRRPAPPQDDEGLEDDDDDEEQFMQVAQEQLSDQVSDPHELQSSDSGPEHTMSMEPEEAAAEEHEEAEEEHEEAEEEVEEEVLEEEEEEEEESREPDRLNHEYDESLEQPSDLEEESRLTSPRRPAVAEEEESGEPDRLHHEYDESLGEPSELEEEGRLTSPRRPAVAEEEESGEPDRLHHEYDESLEQPSELEEESRLTSPRRPSVAEEEEPELSRELQELQQEEELEPSQQGEEVVPLRQEEQRVEQQAVEQRQAELQREVLQQEQLPQPPVPPSAKERKAPPAVLPPLEERPPQPAVPPDIEERRAPPAPLPLPSREVGKSVPSATPSQAAQPQASCSCSTKKLPGFNPRVPIDRCLLLLADALVEVAAEQPTEPRKQSWRRPVFGGNPLANFQDLEAERKRQEGVPQVAGKTWLQVRTLLEEVFGFVSAPMPNGTPAAASEPSTLASGAETGGGGFVDNRVNLLVLEEICADESSWLDVGDDVNFVKNQVSQLIFADLVNDTVDELKRLWPP